MKPFFGANWKMNGSGLEGLSWLQTIKESSGDRACSQLVLFPPFTLLPVLAEDAREAGIELGGQNLFFEPSGAFTGEISASMLVEAGCTWVIVGHSERRHVLHEDDATVGRKLFAALGSGLGAVLCVGEKIEERDAGQAGDVVERQLTSALGGSGPVDGSSLVVAYEPVWAIGTGRNASPGDIETMHALTREVLSRVLPGDAGSRVRIIYGGSVKPSNAAGILAVPGVDGALVGGASLDPASFQQIAGAGRAAP